MQAETLVVEVVGVLGSCPVHVVGDCFAIEDGYKLVADGPVCMHALHSVAPYYVALSRGVDAADLGLAGPAGSAHVQCLDPQQITGGGTVTFRIRVRKPEGQGDSCSE